MKQKYNVSDHVIIEESNIESIYPCAGKTGVIMYSDGSDKHPHWVKVDGGSEVYCAVKCLVGEKKIVITTDGKVTTAKLYEDGKTVKTATAKCSPEDTFDFGIGAKLALERLTAAEKPKEQKYNIKFNDGDYAKIVACHHGHKFDIGTIVKLEKHEDDYFARPKDGNGQGWWVLDDELEAYTPKYYNGKVVCVKTKYPWWTVGKVYDVVDGVIKDDYGDEYPNKNHFPSFKPYRDADDVRHAGCRSEDDNGRHNIFNEFIPLVEDKDHNRPLTNEELMKMDGQKVWLSSIVAGGENFTDKYCGWRTVNAKEEALFHADGKRSYSFEFNGARFGFRAYLRPQK